MKPCATTVRLRLRKSQWYDLEKHFAEISISRDAIILNNVDIPLALVIIILRLNN